MGHALVETMNLVAETVQGVLVKRCGHWMLEECPKETINALISFL
jgi:hypothetical protein